MPGGRRYSPREPGLDGGHDAGGQEVTAKRPELLEATDETIVDAMQYADPMVLRGLLYQLTGDEELVRVRLALGAGREGAHRPSRG